MSTTAAIVRFSYLNAFTPKAQKNPDGSMGEPKYSTCCLIPKEDKESIKVIKDAVQYAISKGLAETTNPKRKLTQGMVNSSKFKALLRDGDEYYNEQPGPDREAYKGCMFFNASNTKPVGIVDEKGKPIIDPNSDKIYSGMWGRIDCGLYVYNVNGNVGIGAGFNNMMFVRHGDRLDGAQSAESAFAEFAVTEDKSDLQ